MVEELSPDKKNLAKDFVFTEEESSGDETRPAESVRSKRNNLN